MADIDILSDYEQRRLFNIKEKEITIPQKHSSKLSEISKPKLQSKKRKKSHLDQEEMSAVRRSSSRSKKPKLQNTHTEEPINRAELPFSCLQCNQRFQFQDQIDPHMTEYHEIEAEPLPFSGSSHIELENLTENK